MDDDLVDVLIVCGVLTFGVIGALILIASNMARFRSWSRCCKKEEEFPIKTKRTTIKVIRKANTISAEEGKSVAARTPVSRIFSSPLPQAQQLPSPAKAKELLFIVPRSPTYRAELAQCHPQSPYMSHSTASSYLPSQIPPLMKRRCSS